MRAFLVLLALFVNVATAHADGDAFARCAEHLPFGIPTLSVTIKSTPICHKGYATLHDDVYLIPRWVSYHLTGPHTLGCEKRGNNFHPDENLPAEHRATPKDYTNSGYSRGHNAPAQDFAWNKPRLSDSFSMANMTPQLQALNGGQWERGEETERAIAYERGELIVYTGGVIPKSPKTIGRGVAVPKAYWKVMVDPEANEALAFMMPQRDIGKGKLDPWLVSIADIEEAASVKFPLPESIDKEAESQMWPADISAWQRKHKAMCAR